MVSFEQLIQNRNKHLALNRDRGTLDISGDRITLLHQNYVKEILYNEIESIIRKKKGVIVLTLKNGEKFQLLDVIWAYNNKSLQMMRNAVRTTEIIFNLLMEKWKTIK